MIEGKKFRCEGNQTWEQELEDVQSVFLEILKTDKT